MTDKKDTSPANNAYTTAEDFLSEAGKLKQQFIPADKLGLKNGVWARELTAAEHDEVIKRGGRVILYGKGDDSKTEFDPATMRQASLYIMSNTIVDPDGNQLFGGSRGEAKLKRISGRISNVIVGVVRELSGLTEKAKAEAKKEPEGPATN